VADVKKTVAGLPQAVADGLLVGAVESGQAGKVATEALAAYDRQVTAGKRTFDEATAQEIIRHISNPNAAMAGMSSVGMQAALLNYSTRGATSDFRPTASASFSSVADEAARMSTVAADALRNGEFANARLEKSFADLLKSGGAPRVAATVPEATLRAGAANPREYGINAVTLKVVQALDGKELAGAVGRGHLTPDQSRTVVNVTQTFVNKGADGVLAAVPGLTQDQAVAIVEHAKKVLEDMNRNRGGNGGKGKGGGGGGGGKGGRGRP
jgi:hypothetical protein